jgi:hypothetical protein
MTSAQTAIFRWVMGIVAAVIAGVIVFEFTHGGAGVTPVDYSGMYDGQTVGGPNGGTVQLQVNEASTASGSTTAEITWGGSLNGSGPLQGTFNANNITFDGEFNSNQGPWDIEMPCTFGNSGNVSCQFQMQAVAPNYSSPQQGSLSADKS